MVLCMFIGCWPRIIIVHVCVWLKLLYASECTRMHLRKPKIFFSSGACPQAPYSKGSLGSPMLPLTAIFSTLANIFAPPPPLKKKLMYYPTVLATQS